MPFHILNVRLFLKNFYHTVFCMIHEVCANINFVDATSHSFTDVFFSGTTSSMKY